jgi:diguanylate cyclase (GGDEF)-like protein
LFGSDLTAVIHGQQELKYLAYHDKLTGLRNRDAFYEQLDQILLDLPRDTERRLTAILFCDLDSFKLVNDTLGHDIGDLVLREVAGRLKDSLRKSDFVFRLGGDEFTIIVRHLKAEYEAKTVAEKILKKLSEPYLLRNHRITYLSTSIGIVFIPNEGTDRETLVKKADTAMYDAKKKGKNQFQFFKDDMTEDSFNRMKIENNLQTLVKNDIYDKECSILYQPIIEQNSDGKYKIIGSEALLRWTNPELGPMMPDSFIPVAEETNLITPMGDWIFHKTCKDIKPLIDKFDNDFYVSINLSARQLECASIVEKLKKIIEIVGINPKNVQLELTETSYLTDQVEVLKNIEQLSKLGIKLAIDDFGIGFASLVYLQRIPASTIKIDRSFIKHVCSSDKHKQLVKSIIDLGYNLNKEVIAEGVEKQEHVTFLGSQNCNKYQGFFFSRPITIDKLANYTQKDVFEQS